VIPRYAYAERCMACRGAVKRDSASWCAGCWSPTKAPEAADACQRCLVVTGYKEAFPKCVFNNGGG